MEKIKITANIDKDLINWIDRGIEKKKFANRTHGIEYCIKKVKGSSSL